jgi:hypothetical protein
MRGLFKPVSDMIYGPNQQRLKAVISLMSWFAMGAFIASTLEYHFDLKFLTEQTAAVWGGATATVAALLIKSV